MGAAFDKRRILLLVSQTETLASYLSLPHIRLFPGFRGKQSQQKYPTSRNATQLTNSARASGSGNRRNRATVKDGAILPHGQRHPTNDALNGYAKCTIARANIHPQGNGSDESLKQPAPCSIWGYGRAKPEAGLTRYTQPATSNAVDKLTMTNQSRAVQKGRWWREVWNIQDRDGGNQEAARRV